MVAGLVPQDRGVFENDLAGKAICDLPESSPSSPGSLLDPGYVPDTMRNDI